MSEILIQSNDLRQAADQFKDISKDMIVNTQKMDEAMLALERKWSGASQQVFYQKYKDLHQAMEGISILLKNIGDEMYLLAERINKIDMEE